MGFYFNFIKLIIALKPLLDKDIEYDLKRVELLSKELRFKLLNMGPTFVKLGQILSLRYDIFPKATCEELQILLDEEPLAMEYDEVLEILKRNFDNSGEIKDISKEPIAVASIAQVHKARIGEIEVALKIQKPGIRKVLFNEIKSIRNSLFLLKLFPEKYRYTLYNILSEFCEWTLKELDFTLEATNIDKFANTYSQYDSIIPLRTLKEFTNNEILTTEYIKGVSAKRVMQSVVNADGDVLSVDEMHFSKENIVTTLEKIVFDQLFTKGVIHGDPHPSNILFTDDQHVAFLDFGITLQLNPTQQDWFKRAVFHLACNERKELIEDLLSFDQRTGAASEEEILKKTAPLFDKLQSSLSEEYSPTKFFIDLVNACGSVDIQVPRFLVLMAKILMTYDGMLQAIKPDANLVNELLPYFEQEKVNGMLSFDELKKDALKTYKALNDAFDLVTALPGETLGLVQDIRKDGIKIVDTAKEKGFIEEAKTKKRSYSIMLFMVLIIISFFSFFGTLIYAGDDSIFTWVLFVIFAIILLITIFYLFKHDA